MQIVIDIPDKEYEEIIDNKLNKSWDMTHYERVIANGTPLPKGHGRLIDADEFIKQESCCGYIEDMDIDYFKQKAPTIIEADK